MDKMVMGVAWIHQQEEQKASKRLFKTLQKKKNQKTPKPKPNVPAQTPKVLTDFYHEDLVANWVK